MSNSPYPRAAKQRKQSITAARQADDDDDATQQVLEEANARQERKRALADRRSGVNGGW